VSSRLRFALAACAALLVAQPALAQDEPDLAGGLKFSGAPTPQEILAQQRACEARKPPRKPAGALNESTYRRLERIMDSISKNQYGDAEAKLNELAGMVKSDYEKAIIQQTIGFVYASTNREMLAVKAFEQAVATNAMPQQVHEQMMFNIAQLYITDGSTLTWPSRATRSPTPTSCWPASTPRRSAGASRSSRSTSRS
jgi:hypothetical protein